MTKIELKTFLADSSAATPSAKIVRVLSERGALSGARIAGITGLAKSTVSMTLAELRKSGIIVDGINQKPEVASVGRPSTTVTLNPSAGTCVGVLFGLQHIQMVIADVSHAVLAEKRFYIDPDYSPARGAEITNQLIGEACDELGISTDTILGVGIAIAAPVNPLTGRIMRAGGVPTWTGVDIKAEFEPVLGHQIFADNESNCSAIAEMMWGAAQGYEDFIMFTIDVGVGGAIVNRGRVITGIAGAAGEFGHMSIDPNGPLCRCGNRGCLETFISGPALTDLLRRSRGEVLSVHDIVRLAHGGDTGCQRAIADAGRVLGRVVAAVCNVFNPDTVVVGGDLGEAGDVLLDPMREAVGRYAIAPAAEDARIVAGVLGERAQVLGALALALLQSEHLAARLAPHPLSIQRGGTT